MEFHWLLFSVSVLVLLGIDIWQNRRPHEIGLLEAGLWSAGWVLVSLVFCAFVWSHLGAEQGKLFLTGYVLEKSLSVDNLAVFVGIFAFFGVERKYHHHVLYWGVMGAIVMRVLFLSLGSVLLSHFHFVLFLFGPLLIFLGWKMAFGEEEEPDPEKRFVVKLFRRWFPVTDGFRGDHFFVRESINGGPVRLMATPLFITVLTIEAMDLVFAVDSVPTILAVSTDPFIIISSNIFAILGLRSLYFALAALMPLLRYLKAGVSLVLVFIGIKLLLVSLEDICLLLNRGLNLVSVPHLPVLHSVHIPTSMSLSAVGAILGLSVLSSLLAVWMGSAKQPDTGHHAGH